MATEREWAARDLAEAEDRYERCARDYSELCTAFHERGRRIKELEKSLADAKAEGRREAFEAFERELDERLLSASSRESALLMDLKVAVRALAKEEG